MAYFLGSPGMNLIEGMLVESGAPDGVGGTGAAPVRGLPRRLGAAARLGGRRRPRVPGPTSCSACGPRRCTSSADGAIAASVIIVELLGAETHVICHTETGARIIVRQGASAARPSSARRCASPSTPTPPRTTSSTPTAGPDWAVPVTVRWPGPIRAGAEAGPGPRHATTRSSHGLRHRLRKEALLAYLLLLPALVLFGVFSFYPFLRNFKLMLYETPPVPGLPAHYVGLHQIMPTITSTQFTQSLVTTVLFVVLVVPIS